MLFVIPSYAQVAIEPTGNDELPAAILGEGEIPKGKDFSYFPTDPNTVGYLVVPEGGKIRGGVILIHEWNGLVDRIRQTADALAAEGYIALAVDLYSGKTGQSREENLALVQQTQSAPNTIIANLNAAVKSLKSRLDSDNKVVAMGWCFGGGIALSYALGSHYHDGTAIFYGRLLANPEEMSKIHHEVYGTFAENDSLISPDEVDTFVEALRAANIENDVHIYDHVEHGFWLHVDRDSETNTAPALDAWKRLKAYLKRITE